MAGPGRSGDLLGVALTRRLTTGAHHAPDRGPGQTRCTRQSDSLHNVTLHGRPLLNGGPQRRDGGDVHLVVFVRLVLLEPGGELVRVGKDLVNCSF